MYPDYYCEDLDQSIERANTCNLCGSAISAQVVHGVDLLGPICRGCEEKLKKHSVYKCLFCHSAGFIEEDKGTVDEPEILVTVSCPFCYDPLNKLPI